KDPSRHSFLPLHHLCLFKLGVPLGELWYLHELATWLRAHGRSRFLLTAPPLRLPGVVGSPLTPVATVCRTREAEGLVVGVDHAGDLLEELRPAARVEQVL